MSIKRHDAKSYRERLARTGEPVPWLIRITYGRGLRWRHTVDGKLSKAQAEALDRHYRVRLEQGLDPLGAADPGGRRPEIATWGELRVRYWDLEGRFLGWAGSLEDHLDRITVTIGADRPLGQLDIATITEAVATWRVQVVVLVSKRGKRRVLGPNSPTTINTRLRVLARVLRYGAEVLHGRCATMPAVAWRELRLQERDRNPRASYQPPERRDAVRAQAVPHVRHALRIAELTGHRIGSVLGLRWELIDREAGVYQVRTKSRKPGGAWQTYPLTAELLAELDAIGWQAKGSVITYNGAPVASIKTGVRGARRRAGAPGFTAKSLRHTAAIEILAAGGSLDDAGAVLGHSDSSVTRRHYSGDLGLERVRAALERRAGMSAARGKKQAG